MTATNTEQAAATANEMINHATGDDSEGSQYLTFALDGEEYGVDIMRVQEIKGWIPVTRIPNTPEYMQGVLNLRGTIVPIIDMRMRFNLEREDYTAITVIIVLSVKCAAGDRVIGLVVDSVSDVINVNATDIKPTPDFGSAVNTEFLNGLATVGDTMVMLLEVDKLLSVDEVNALASTGASPSQGAAAGAAAS